jgi:NAD(P)-dependent dehydrogenase (short-subunit alcohol dehydrogenase family)
MTAAAPAGRGRLSGKTALVTGAAGGIGAEIARAFAREGAFVLIGDIDGEAGAATAAGIAAELAAAGGPAGAGADGFVLDVASEPDWVRAVAAVRRLRGRLDVLVNNAGINIRKDIEEMPADSLDAMLAVNVKGPYLGIKHCLPFMRAGGGGTILNMSSLCGLVGHRYTNEAYTMTKGAVALLTKSVAVRYGRDNVRCNSVHPSTVDTPLVRTVLADPAKRAERLGEVPLGRLAAFGDVAAVFVFLASDEAAFINGAAVPVDGGAAAD